MKAQRRCPEPNNPLLVFVNIKCWSCMLIVSLGNFRKEVQSLNSALAALLLLVSYLLDLKVSGDFWQMMNVHECSPWQHYEWMNEWMNLSNNGLKWHSMVFWLHLQPNLTFLYNMVYATVSSSPLIRFVAQHSTGAHVLR